MTESERAQNADFRRKPRIFAVSPPSPRNSSIWRVQKTADFRRSGESNRLLTPMLSKSIAIHLPFLSRYFCKSMPSRWQTVAYTPPICITIRLPFVSQYFCKSIRVKSRRDTPIRRKPKTKHRRFSAFFILFSEHAFFALRFQWRMLFSKFRA